MRSAESVFNPANVVTHLELGFITRAAQFGPQIFPAEVKQPKKVAVDVVGMTLKRGVMR